MEMRWPLARIAILLAPVASAGATFNDLAPSAILIRWGKGHPDPRRQLTK
jgi:hypothetical protein